jgi:hypothetical protein
MPILTTGAGAYRVGGAPAYTGPGDVQTFTLWAGLRAYSAAKAAATAAIVDLVDQAGANPITINCTTAGALDSSAITTWVAANSVSTIKVTKLYDQVGTNHLVQATLANMPVLTANSLNTSYGLTFTAANSQQLVATSAISPQTQPYYIYAVAKATASADRGLWAADSGGFAGAIAEFQAAGPVFAIYAGNVLSATITYSAWHAIQSLFSSTSSVISVDNTETTGNAGTQGAFNVTSAPLRFGNDITSFFDGSGMEIGYINATVSGGNRTSLNSNAHAAYGSW